MKDVVLSTSSIQEHPKKGLSPCEFLKRVCPVSALTHRLDK